MSVLTEHRPENEKQKSAFEYYYGLGYKRTYAAVAKKFDVSIRTVKNWSGLYDWRKRVNQADEVRVAALRLSLSFDGAENMQRLLRITQLMKARALKSLKGPEQKPTIRELVSLISARLDLHEKLKGLSAGGFGDRSGHVVLCEADEE
ncbi:MAG: hypothetical protein KKH67_09330 [candidate division Zixibacteria bacterium]|nr:hypothetical protein [candidate division Zixibacteria bacterium]